MNSWWTSLFVLLVIHTLQTGRATYSSDEDTFLCDLVTASNVETIKGSDWDCSNTANKCTDWDGIICTSGVITKIDLANDGVSGTLPSSIGSLTELSFLFLKYNSFSGTLPSTVGCLNLLKQLQVHQNSFHSSLPDMFSSMSQLTKLYLDGNSFTGNLPVSLSALNLETFSVKWNSFDGTLPTYIGSWTDLTVLALEDNIFTGSIPTTFASLTKLSMLFLEENSLHGSVPDIFGSMSQLAELTLKMNSFTGSLPSSMGSLSNLQQLDMSVNSLTDIPSTLSQLSGLTLLDLGSCPLSGVEPLEKIMKLSNLEFLHIGNANFSSTLPSTVGSLDKLSYLSLAVSKISGSIPSDVSNMGYLTELRLYGNDFTGTIPSVVWGMTGLKKLLLNWNDLQGSIPSDIGSLSMLVTLGLEDNDFSGIIPSNIASLDSLTSLVLGLNSFGGVIPSSIGDLSKLVILEMNGNSLGGVVPSHLGDLSKMEVLLLQDNSLSGALPSELAVLTKLKELRLEGNNMNGAFPSELCSIASLTKFWLTSTIDACVFPEPSGHPTNEPSGQPTSEPTALSTGQPTSQPSGHPTSQPSGKPTGQPSSQPSGEPTGQPTGQPSCQPTGEPTGAPTGLPSGEPTGQPTGQPSGLPTGQPSCQPTGEPTACPTGLPSGEPTGQPTSQPSGQPTGLPSGAPTSDPSGAPTGLPSSEPTGQPTGQPSGEPTGQPSGEPSGQPTAKPTGLPSGEPTTQPSGQPTGQPSSQPSGLPTGAPTGLPSGEPTGQPIGAPTSDPSGAPTGLPSGEPTGQPTGQPTGLPSGAPTSDPSGAPTGLPSGEPTGQPTGQPSDEPTGQPSGEPSGKPTAQPTGLPSGEPTTQPSGQPTGQPSSQPSGLPTGAPTGLPSSEPTGLPSGAPTSDPSGAPTGLPSGEPTGQPTGLPSGEPSGQPTAQPTGLPSGEPTTRPSGQPTGQPSSQPSGLPTGAPTGLPSGEPTGQPTGAPTSDPSGAPTGLPSGEPTGQPSGEPSGQPTAQPTGLPSGEPTTQPSGQPTGQPSSQPSGLPTGAPTGLPSGEPTGQPTGAPTSDPSGAPTGLPSGEPTGQPSGEPSGQPTAQPTGLPSGEPTTQPSGQPTGQPSSQPSGLPTGAPTGLPSGEPTGQPTGLPSGAPTGLPSGEPTGQPSGEPSGQPTAQPTGLPSGEPTTQPSGQPTGQPSSQPSGDPTGLPSGQPSGLPSGEPTGYPTGEPSGQPSSHPSGQPSLQPTGLPSGKPTGQPSSAPTSQPSCRPSGRPSFLPTGQPTGFPSGKPTSDPSGEPTSQPSGLPSSGPTGLPTGQPTGEPTGQPTGYPTGQPTYKPTGVPTGCPTGRPTGMPSGDPSSQPTDLPTGSPSGDPSSEPTGKPTSQPSLTPSSQPSCVPSGDPTLQPSGQPTCQPSSVPSENPSNTPSVIPSSEPSEVPTSLPSGFPTVLPSSAPSQIPTVYPSGVPSSLPSAEPTSSPTRRPTVHPTVLGETNPPTSAPTLLPTLVPSQSPSSLPTTSVPTSQPTLSPTHSPAPIILNLDIDILKSEVTITTRLSKEGRVYCGVYVLSSPPLSITSVIVNNNFAVVEYPEVFTELRIGALQPSTNYNVYCVARSIYGVTTSYSDMMLNKKTIRTQCCKKIAISLAGLSYFEGTDVSSFLTVAADAAPSSPLSLTFTAKNIDSNLTTAMFFPTSVVIYSHSWEKTRYVALSGSTAGRYMVSVSSSGIDAADYEIAFSGRNEFNLISSNVKPPVPMLSSAVFTSDGSSIVLKFDSSTDMGGQSSTFTCSLLFSFVGDDNAVCEWTTPSTVLMSLGGNVRANVGDNITVVTNTLRAACLLSFAECMQWESVLSTLSVSISAPDAPIVPIVVVSGPEVSGQCDEVILDFLSSTGSGGRRWKNITVVVHSQSTSVERLNDFFMSTYELSPPTPIPFDFLESGNFYDFHVSLCNFLGKCSLSIHQLYITNNAVPNVRLLGPKSRSMAVGTSLLLQAQAYMSECDGSKSYAGLVYSWSVTRDGVLDSSVSSSARDLTKYRILPYTLEPGSVYEFSVQVTSDSGQKSTSSSFVTTTKSPLVAVISGGTHQTVRRGDSIVIDASKSYDADTADDAHLSYIWSCYQRKPRLSTECGLYMSVNRSVVVAHPLLTTGVASEFVVTVSVSDSSRESERSVYITIGEASDPVVTVSMKNTAQKVNPTDALTLLGSVELSVPAMVKWVVEDGSIDLAQLSRTTVSKVIGPGQHVFNLVIMENSLVGRASPYIFSLSVDDHVMASLSVIVNSAPSPGTFAVSPPNGTAIVTKFTFAATLWTDDDSPVSFQFGYLSKRGNVNVVRGRSESGYGSTTLPAGQKNRNNELTCHVVVFDVLNAYSSATNDVVVGETQLNSADLQTKIARDISTNSGSLDGTKETLSVASSILNTKDCSYAPHCAALHREECDITDNTCGQCLSGYVGIEGDDNSECLSAETIEVNPGINATASCSADNDCGLWEFCDMESFVCNKLLKPCRQNCTGSGKCMHENVDSGAPVEECFMDDTTCVAVCECIEGFSGELCQMSAAELELKKSIRQQLLVGLESVCETDEPSADSIYTWQSSLSAITQSSEELSPEASEVALNIASSILSGASEYVVSHDSLLGVLNSIDSAVIASQSSSKDSVRRRLSSLIDSIDLLDRYGYTIAGDIVEGQNAIESINKMFRLTTQVISSIEDIVFPQTTAEQLSGIDPAMLVFNGDSDSTLRVSAMSVKARLYNETEDLNSNALRVQFVDSTLGTNSTVTFVIQNIVETAYESINGSLTVNTTCVDGDSAEYEYICPGGLGNDMTIRHKCNGSAAIMKTICPTVTKVPACRVLSGESFNCSVKSFTAASIMCSCSLKSGGSERRSLSWKDSGALEVAAVTELVVEDFSTTILTTSDFDSTEDLKNTMIVVLLYGVMWVGGLIGISMCSLRQRYTHRKINEDQSILELKKKLASTTKLAADVRSYLTAYVNEVFPAVFLHKPGMRRLWDEICKHHRYFVLFTASGANGDHERMLTGIHLLTIQSMLMFVLAVCYDLQYPQDDGSCGTHTTESSCLRQKSAFDADKSMCSWNEDHASPSGYTCTYIPPTMTLWVVVLISVVVAMVTAPVNLLVDFLFIEILSAPTTDALKIKERESVVKRAARRASAVGRRMSAVSTAAVKRLHKKVFKKSNSSMELTNIRKTRVVPDSMETAHSLASASVRDILFNVKEKIDSDVSTQDIRRRESSTFKTTYSLMQHRQSLQLRNSDINNIQFDHSDPAVNDLFLELTVDIADQRRSLKRSLKEAFDSSWGIDPTGEFSKQIEKTIAFTPRTRSAERTIKEELSFVQNETEAKFEKLRFATDVQIGMEILHLFIIDLLGRDTPAAKIFLTKSEEEHSFVVTPTVKVIAWIVVALLNLFFVYFSVLRGLERGIEWQRLFLIACIMQFLIEIVFYETSECAIVHFFIPDLARNEVRSAGLAIHQAVQKVCASTIETRTNIILDAPRYLFVSTNLAKRFPDLLESIIVMSYHTYSPGDLSRKWRFSHYTGPYATMLNPWSRSWSRVGRFTFSAMFVGMLQRMGAMSPTIQRVVIHTLQPLAVSVLFLVGVLLKNNPIFICVLAPLILYKIYTFIQDYNHSSDNSYSNNVYPTETLPDKGGSVSPNNDNVVSTLRDRRAVPVDSDDDVVKKSHEKITHPDKIAECPQSDNITEKSFNVAFSEASFWSNSSKSLNDSEESLDWPDFTDENPEKGAQASSFWSASNGSSCAESDESCSEFTCSPHSFRDVELFGPD